MIGTTPTIFCSPAKDAPSTASPARAVENASRVTLLTSGPSVMLLKDVFLLWVTMKTSHHCVLNVQLAVRAACHLPSALLVLPTTSSMLTTFAIQHALPVFSILRPESAKPVPTTATHAKRMGPALPAML